MTFSENNFPEDDADHAGLGFARIGAALLRQRELDEAIQILSEGTRLHPSHLTGFLLLAKTYRESGRVSEAANVLKNILRLDSRCPAALKLLSEIAEKSGDAALEAQYLGQLAAQEPWNENVQSAHRRARALAAPIPQPAAIPRPETRPKIAVAVKPEENLAEEEDELEEIEEDAVTNVATITLAEIYFQQGLKEQALLIYRQLSESQPDNETVRKRLGEIQASLGASKPEGS